MRQNLGVRSRYLWVAGLVALATAIAFVSRSFLSAPDLVMVSPGAIPITTSGKVRRATCVEHYRQNQFARVDA